METNKVLIMYEREMFMPKKGWKRAELRVVAICDSWGDAEVRLDKAYWSLTRALEMAPYTPLLSDDGTTMEVFGGESRHRIWAWQMCNDNVSIGPATIEL